MKNLVKYSVDEIIKDPDSHVVTGDYKVTMSFDDDTKHTEVIHFGAVESQDHFTSLVKDYAAAWVHGKQVEEENSIADPTKKLQLKEPQEVV